MNAQKQDRKPQVGDDVIDARRGRQRIVAVENNYFQCSGYRSNLWVRGHWHPKNNAWLVGFPKPAAQRSHA